MKISSWCGRSMAMVCLLCLWAVLMLAGQAQADAFYWTDGGGDIRRANLDGSGQEVLVSGLPDPQGMALDLAGGKMYWANYDGRDIRRANLDGSGEETVVSGLLNPRGIALDVTGGKMYWTDISGGDIRRANLDGSGQETLVSGLILPGNIALDVGGGKMYWTDQTHIRRANLDGSGQETILSAPSDIPGPPKGIALDLASGQMYWAETIDGSIRRASLDGSGKQTLISGLNFPYGIALDLVGGKIYWTDLSDNKIRRANLDGSGRETLVSGLNQPVGIALDLSGPVTEPVLVTGYSADVISDKDSPARFAQPFNGGTFAWFEAGGVDDYGVQQNDGLPAGLTFVSATGSGATYQVQPANANNVLQLSAGQTGTLTLTTATAYGTLYVIASSGDGTPSSVGSGTINFADGSTQAFSYNSFDWCNGQGGLHPQAVLPGPIGRADIGPNGTAFVYNEDCDFQFYESVIAIDPSHAGVAIASIDFTGAPDAFSSNIFGFSGQ